MPRRSLWLALALLPACAAGPRPERTTAPLRCGPGPDGAHSFGVLHINDVYRIEGLADGRGGLARVAGLRRALQATCPDLLMTHGGDALYPSLLSTKYRGEHMVAVLNTLDGDASRFDDRLFAVFGNHEFDRRRWKDAAGLDARLEQSAFTWLDTSIRWGIEEGAQAPAIDAPSLARRRVVDAGGLRVGLFGLTLDKAIPDYAALDGDPVALARAETAALRAEGADVVIAVTHLDARDDRRVAALGDAGPDLLLGGHDHAAMELLESGRWILKADADAATAQVAWVTVDRSGLRVEHERVAIGPDTPAEPVSAAEVQRWWDRFIVDVCGDRPGCLSEPIGRTQVALRAEELEIRRFETNLGDWIADQMRAAYPGADAALLNAGSLRLNQDLPAGAALTGQILAELLPYDGGLALVELTGAQLAEVLAHAVTDWTGSGHWLQISGLAYRHDPDRAVAEQITVLAPDGAAPLDPARTLRVVVPAYLLDRSGDQDGYRMLGPEQVVQDAGVKLTEVVRGGWAQAGDAGIAPIDEGRICTPMRPDRPCLAVP